MQYTVTNRTPNFRIFTLPAVDGLPLGEMKLDPGANIVEEVDYKRARLVPAQDILFAKRLVTAMPVPAAVESFRPEAGPDAKPDVHQTPESVESLAKLKVLDALAAVKACEDPALLALWMTQDGRKRVKAAMVEREAELAGEVAPEASEEDGDESDQDSE